ncbi:hypothetical protein KGF54_004599 [Candida jiufengensis]|uniref:uncharacterized protein n=1 Tax=Candida jiufengensis TaxID=497108 RepID=UPI002224AC85|nr:uncharacterized protein KGF54_004599 [Candida jiufengensis]KAI5951525.1 hypothetical protein KGF54_004599 [Candida jiufengensis]
MPHPGRPKGRMNKKTQQIHQEALARAQAAQQQGQQAHRAAQHNQQHPHHQQQHPSRNNSAIKEDGGITLHDEADLISYRNDALIRYVSNHEYIENITAKVIHSTKIIPPTLYPNLPKRNKEDYSTPMNPEEIYYGDLEYMKHVDGNLIKNLKIMKSDDDPGFTRYLFNCPQYKVQQKRNSELEKLERDVHNKESLHKLEEKYDSVLKEYKSKFDREYVILPHVEQYSIPTSKLDPNLKVEEAPKDYDPRKIMEERQKQQQEQSQKNQSQQQQPLPNYNLNAQPQEQIEFSNMNGSNGKDNINHQNNNNGVHSANIENSGDFSLPMNQMGEENSLLPEDSRSNGQIAQSQPQQQQPKPVQEVIASNANQDNEDDDDVDDDNSNGEGEEDEEHNQMEQEEDIPQQDQQSQQPQQEEPNHNALADTDLNVLFDDNHHDVDEEMNDINDDENNKNTGDNNNNPLGMDVDVDVDVNDHSAIVNDDIGELYNFDGDDDLMGGDSGFEHDFLDQINNMD